MKFRSIIKNKIYLLGEDYKILKNRSYMKKTRNRIYSRNQVMQNIHGKA